MALLAAAWLMSSASSAAQQTCPDQRIDIFELLPVEEVVGG